MACNSCTILFQTAWTTCCDTLKAQCSKMAAEATEIECLIKQAELRGELFVYVNKHMLNDDMIKALNDSCYKVEFVPNDPGKCCNLISNCEDTANLNGVYKISWCICTCNSSTSDCCDDLPDGCVASSCSEETLPADSGTDEPADSGSDCDC